APAATGTAPGLRPGRDPADGGWCVAATCCGLQMQGSLICHSWASLRFVPRFPESGGSTSSQRLAGSAQAHIGPAGTGPVKAKPDNADGILRTGNQGDAGGTAHELARV